MINRVCKCYHQTLLSSLAVFWIRIHYNADPDPGLSQTPFESGSINQGVKAKNVRQRKIKNYNKYLQ